MSTSAEAAVKKEVPKTEAPRFLPLETIAAALAVPAADEVFGIVSNMSETGACIITNRALSADTIVELQLANPRHGVILQATARVVWSAERLEPIREIVGFLTGLSFSSDKIPDIRKVLSAGAFQPVP